MIKQVKKTYGGMIKDTSKSKTPETMYYDATYSKITATDGSTEMSKTNVKGNSLKVIIPTVSIENNIIKYLNKTVVTSTLNYNGSFNDNYICGHTSSTKGLILFSELSNDTQSLSAIWLYDDKHEDLKLLYLNDLGLTRNSNIVSICNYETDKIEKVYWVDGVHQLRSLNIEHSTANGDNEEIYDIPVSMLDAVAPFNMSPIRIKELTSGGKHTAGMIQYSYSLYKINGSQSGVVPMTDLIPLKKTDSGGDVNENVDTLPIIEIDDIDDTFDNIKVYSIKYTSLNETPTIKVILDSKIPNNRTVTIYDDNTSDRTITIEEFLFLSSNIIIPSDIVVKDNILFMSNYHEKNMKLNLDMRAFQFSSSGISKVYHNLKSLNNWENELTIENVFPVDNSVKHDSINLDYDVYKFKKDGVTRGGSGKFCEFSLTSSNVKRESRLYFKDDEIYRLGILFYNKYGKYSEPHWVCDFKAPSGNLLGFYNIIDFNLTSDFYDEVAKIEDDYVKPVGYKVLIADRSEKDSSIVVSGIITSGMINYKGSSKPNFESLEERIKLTAKEAKMPNFLIRNINSDLNNDFDFSSKTYPLKGSRNHHLMSVDSNNTEIVVGGRFGGRTWQYNNLLQIYAPELTFNKGKSIPTNTKLNIKGSIMNTFNAVWGKELDVESGNASVDVRGYDGVVPKRSKYTEIDLGNERDIFDTGMIEHPGGSNPNRYQRVLWYRQYGVTPYNEETGTGTGDGKSLVYYTSWMNESPKPNEEAKLVVNPGDEDYSFRLVHTYKSKDIAKVTIDIEKLKIKTDSQNSVFKFNLVGECLTIKNKPSSHYEFKVESQKGTFESSNFEQIVIDDIKVIDYIATSPFKLTLESVSGDELSGESNIQLRTKTFNSEGELISEYESTLLQGLFNLSQTTSADVRFDITPSPRLIDVVGTPEFTLKGQSFKNYSNIGEFRYVNTLTSFKADGRRGWKEDGDYGRRIISINANNDSCVSLFLRDLNTESLYRSLGFKRDSSIMYGELVRSKEDIYLGGLYGGNRYEEKLRTKYREIGEYQKLTPSHPSRLNTILSPGDVYVQVFKFLRMSKDSDNIDQGTYQMEEIVEFPCETTINLTCRNDESKMEWSSKLVYDYDKFNKYNNVYSQRNNLILHQAEEYYTKDNESFRSTVIPSRQKSAGELIDSWLNILPNDALSLDGQYGSINKMIKLKDEIFTFQDNAIAHLSVNPRIQIPTEDGIGLQLGTGNTLPNYKYITQHSGCKSFKSIVSTISGIYYYDDVNHSINVFNGEAVFLSETAGLHSYVQNYPLHQLDVKDPRFKEGVISGYDSLNKDVYFTFNFKDFTDTLVFNEKRNTFTTRYKHRVGYYIDYRDKMYCSQSLQDLYLENSGDMNKFFNKYYDTSVTFLINPETDLDTILNTIQFKSEVYLNGVDQSNKTITSYRVYNEFQDTGIVPITSGLRGNSRRYLRDWNIAIARNKNTRERIRNPWNYLTLYFKNETDLKLVLHDVLVSYTI